eukprot:553381_1
MFRNKFAVTGILFIFVIVSNIFYATFDNICVGLAKQKLWFKRTEPKYEFETIDFNWDALHISALYSLYQNKLIINEKTKCVNCNSTNKYYNYSKSFGPYIIEFGYELQGVTAWSFAICKQNVYNVTTASLTGMEPYYFWSKYHKTFNYSRRAGYLPEGNPFNSANAHISLKEFPNSNIWKMPNYKIHFKNALFRFKNKKPTILISNKYNIEWADKPINYFSINTLEKLFNIYIQKGYNIIYKRPINAELLNDDTRQTTELKDHEMIKETFNQKVLTYSNILDYIQYYNKIKLNATFMNLIQLSIMANIDYYVSVQGGNSILNSLFCVTNHIYHASGSELNSGEYSHFPLLNSNNKCNHTIFTNEQDLVQFIKQNHTNFLQKPCIGCTLTDCFCKYYHIN